MFSLRRYLKFFVLGSVVTRGDPSLSPTDVNSFFRKMIFEKGESRMNKRGRGWHISSSLLSKMLCWACGPKWTLIFCYFTVDDEWGKVGCLTPPPTSYPQKQKLLLTKKRWHKKYCIIAFIVVVGIAVDSLLNKDQLGFSSLKLLTKLALNFFIW